MGSSKDTNGSGFTSAAAGEPPDSVHTSRKPHRATLKPPDWKAPASVGSLALERVTSRRPVPRRTGGRAEAATLRAQVHQARERGDFETERQLSAKLARLLVARGTRLEDATKLARRSLLLGEDPKLRQELSAWFASLGQLALAAGTLQLLLEESPGEAAPWIRVATLRARAADARAAMQALRSAFEVDPRDPLPLELLASLHAWAPEMVTKTRAAQALLEAAKRRQARGDERGFAEALLQATEVEPQAQAAADRLARHLSASRRFDAADEVWRRSAGDGPNARDVHELRVREAIGAGDPALALAATLDARADTRLEADSLLTAASIVESGAGQIPVPNFDGLLAPLGLGHLLAARLIWLADAADTPAQRATALTAAARFFLQRSPQRAGTLLCEAVEIHPPGAEAVAALVELVDKSGETTWLTEAQIRLGRRGFDEGGAARLLELSEASLRLGDDALLGTWVLSRVARVIPLPPEHERRLHELRSRAPGGANWLRHGDWQGLSLAELKRASSDLSGQPDSSGQLAEVLLETRRRDPNDVSAYQNLERVLWRLGRLDQLEQLWADGFARSEPLPGAAFQLVRFQVRHGSVQKALAMLKVVDERYAAPELALLSALASVYGDAEQRAMGFAQLARTTRPQVSAVLHCQASAAALALDQREAAYRYAELACHADPKAARPVVCCADVADQTDERVAILALERASELVTPRSKYCRALVELAGRQGEPDVALRWARRWVALTPLDAEASRVLLEQLTASAEAEELAKGLDWFVAQPRPREALAPQLAAAMLRLSALDSRRGVELSRRVLGAYGVAEPAIVEALSEIAARSSEPELRVAVIERLLVGEHEVDRAGLLCEAARLHIERGAGDAAFDALARALEEQADVERIAVMAGECPPPKTSDGELRRLSVRAACAAGRGETAAAIEAWRELGAALWDLAGDRARAVEAWRRAAAMDPEQGEETFARDLVSFCGYPELVAQVSAIVGGQPPDVAANVLTAAASVAVTDGFKQEAAELAEAALVLHPRQTEALAVMERALEDDSERLERAYATAEAALLGCYGERALHYRAARQFERRREHELALRHAILAFEAVPAEGVAYALMLRLASLVGDDARATQALQRVAEASKKPQERQRWFEIAARSAGPGLEGRRLRAEVLLRALTIRAEPEAIARAGSAIAEVMAESPSERDRWERDFDAAIRGLLRGLSQPADAETAIACAKTSAETFENPAQCAAALDRAIALDPSTSRYAELSAVAPLLCSRATAALRVIRATLGALENGQEVSPDLLALALELASRHDKSNLGRLAVEQALLDPSVELVERARRLAEDEPEQLARLDGAIPRQQRVDELWQRADRLLADEPEAAVNLLRENQGASWLTDEDGELLHRKLLVALRRLPDSEALEEYLAARFGDTSLEERERRKFADELIRSLTKRQAHAAALDVVQLLERVGPLTREELGLAVEVARKSGDAERELHFLEPQKTLAASPEGRKALWRRLFELHDQLGRSEAAVQDAERLLELDPSDQRAHAFLIDDARRRQDHPRLVRLLEERLETGPATAEDYLAIADVFLDKLDDRKRGEATLQQGLASLGDHPLILERLARLLQSRRAFERAAQTFERARLAVTEPAEVARLAELACRCYLDAGDSAAALRLLSEKGAAHETEAMARLRVDVLRSTGEPKALAEALEELATIATAHADQRAEWLCEAAQIALDTSDPTIALERARRAARTAPRSAQAQLLARRLEYVERGPGTPAEALATITELRGVGELRDPEQAALRSFLLAEALDQRVGLGAGRRELENHVRRYGDHPLVACARAERLAREGHAADALPLYDDVLVADLGRLRDKNDVLLAAIACAREVSDSERVGRWSAIAKELGLTLPSLPPPKPSVRPEVDARQARKRFAQTWQSAPEPEPASEAPVEVALRPDPRTLGSTWVSGEHHAPITAEAEPAAGTPARAPTRRPEVSSEARASLFPQGGTAEIRPSVPVRVTGRPRMDTDPGMGRVIPTPQVRLGAPPAKPEQVSAQARLSRPPETLFQQGPATPPAESGSSPESGRVADADRSEQELRDAFVAGDVAAGRLLSVRLEAESSRLLDWVELSRQLAFQAPGDLDALRTLTRAVAKDGNAVYAAALEQVQAVCADPAGVPPQAPPLEDQHVAPEALMQLLRGAPEPALEVLSLLWRSAPHLFRVADERFVDAVPIALESSEPLALSSRVVLRAMGGHALQVFHQRAVVPAHFESVLGQPMRVLVTGATDVASSTLLFDLGAALLATHPDYALCFGWTEPRLVELFEAVLAAFGPPGRIRGSAPAVALLAERLWEGVPSRVQRRLQEISGHPDQIDYSHALGAASRAARRAGLFMSGDLAVALGRVCAQQSVDSTRLRGASGLRDLCQSNQAVADLVRFATSLEYALARWGSLSQPAHGLRLRPDAI